MSIVWCGRSGRHAAITAALALGLCGGVAGCANQRLATGSVERPATTMSFDRMTVPQLDAAADQIGRQYEAQPKDKNLAISYATVLQMTGRQDQSLAVMRKLAIAYPKDRDVLAAYGKALAADGQFTEALDAVRRAQTPDYPDWRLISAEGAILDQIGQTDKARALYRKALDIKPDAPSVLSNLGMSYVLTGDLKTAETYLRQAAGQPGADSRVRQNLALVVGLEGRFQEAERIASQDLPPDQAAANVAYLRSMLVQQNAWSELAAGKKKKSKVD